MSATKILWGQILTVLLIVLAAIWGATQYVAWSLGFQPQLGAPWFAFSGCRSTTRRPSSGGGTFSMPMRRRCFSGAR